MLHCYKVSGLHKGFILIKSSRVYGKVRYLKVRQVTEYDCLNLITLMIGAWQSRAAQLVENVIAKGVYI